MTDKTTLTPRKSRRACFSAPPEKFAEMKSLHLEYVQAGFRVNFSTFLCMVFDDGKENMRKRLTRMAG